MLRMVRCCGYRGVLRYPLFSLVFTLGALVSFYYFVSNGGTYDPIGGIGKPDHHIRLKSSHHKNFDSGNYDNDVDSNRNRGIHRLRQLDDDNGEIQSNDDDRSNKNVLRFEGHGIGETGDEVENAKARIRKHCNPPDAKVKGAEGEVSAGYSLEMVHVMIRHGDRSPINSFPSYPSSKINCQLLPARFPHPRLQEFSDKMTQVMAENPPNEARRLGLFPNQKYCEGAQLTGTGTVQQILNGEYLQDVFATKWRLFGPYGDKVLVKSTDYSRTYQSAVALLFGLLPKFDISKKKKVPTATLR